MIVGIVKEIKDHENRVAITPAGVDILTRNNHTVIIEKDAGLSSGISNDEYIEAGAKIIDNAQLVWEAELVLKVKEPVPSEFKYLRKDLILFTYLHLAANKPLIDALLSNEVSSIAYETVQNKDGFLPLLAPMSEVAGRRSIIIAANFLESQNNGSGILLSGVPGTQRGNVVIVGAGVAGLNAAKMAIGLGAKVSILDVNLARLQYLDDTLKNDIQTLYSSQLNLKSALADADVVISTVLIPGANAPKIITEDMVKSMKKGSIIIDISIDQGGSVETITNPTTYDEPIFIKHDVLHYALTNMPGAVPKTSTFALTNSTINYVLFLANNGLKACLNNYDLMNGINTINGKIIYPALSKIYNTPVISKDEIIKMINEKDY